MNTRTSAIAGLLVLAAWSGMADRALADLAPVAQSRTMLPRSQGAVFNPSFGGFLESQTNAVSWAATGFGPREQTELLSATGSGTSNGQTFTTQNSVLGLFEVTASGSSRNEGSTPSTTVPASGGEGNSLFSYTFLVSAPMQVRLVGFVARSDSGMGFSPFGNSTQSATVRLVNGAGTALASHAVQAAPFYINVEAEHVAGEPFDDVFSLSAGQYTIEAQALTTLVNGRGALVSFGEFDLRLTVVPGPAGAGLLALAGLAAARRRRAMA